MTTMTKDIETQCSQHDFITASIFTFLAFAKRAVGFVNENLII